MPPPRTEPALASYLSPEWFDQLNAAVRASDHLRETTRSVHLAVQQVVTGAPGGDVRYWVRVDDGTVETGLGDAARPDVTVTQSYDTAVAVVTGAMSAQAAVMAGRIRVAGDTSLLVAHQEALQGLDEVFAPVRERTEYGG